MSRRLLAAIVLLAFAVTVSACGGSDPAAAPPAPAQPGEPVPPADPPPPPAEPSSTEPAPPPADPPPPPAQTGSEADLPDAVIAKRDAIVAAAHARDYGALEALLDPATFSYSFGEEGDPIGYWRELEDVGEVPILGDYLPGFLAMPFAKLGDIYVWPSVHAKLPKTWIPQDTDPLASFYTQEELESFRQLGSYLGWRVGIREDGTWLYFVSGD
jgi:hypothetical protein